MTSPKQKPWTPEDRVRLAKTDTARHGKIRPGSATSLADAAVQKRGQERLKSGRK